MKTLTIKDFIRLMDDDKFCSVFYKTKEEKELLVAYRNQDCKLCKLAPLVRIVLSKPDDIICFFGDSYKQWADRLRR